MVEEEKTWRISSFINLPSFLPAGGALAGALSNFFALFFSSPLMDNFFSLGKYFSPLRDIQQQFYAEGHFFHIEGQLFGSKKLSYLL